MIAAKNLTTGKATDRGSDRSYPGGKGNKAPLKTGNTTRGGIDFPKAGGPSGNTESWPKKGQKMSPGAFTKATVATKGPRPKAK